MRLTITRGQTDMVLHKLLSPGPLSGSMLVWQSVARGPSHVGSMGVVWGL